MDVLELELERTELMPTAFDGYVERTVRVFSTCLISVARNRYSGPTTGSAPPMNMTFCTVSVRYHSPIPKRGVRSFGFLGNLAIAAKAIR